MVAGGVHVDYQRSLVSWCQDVLIFTNYMYVHVHVWVPNPVDVHNVLETCSEC